MKHISELIPEALQLNQKAEQALTEWKPLKTGSVQQAVNGIKIFKLDSDEPIKQALRYAFTLVGLRGNNLPDEYEKKILIEFIKKKFGGHTAEEIRIAFEKAVAGELDCDPTCYENFSVLYFANIMNSYRGWVRQTDIWPDAAPPQIEPLIDLLDIECDFCYAKQKEIFKQPITFGKMLEVREKLK